MQHAAVGASARVGAAAGAVALLQPAPVLATARRRSGALRIPEHVGFIPDGNRRWATQNKLAKHHGYRAGIEPGISLLAQCRTLGIREVSIYGFTKENVHRPAGQVTAFRNACVDFAHRAIEQGAAFCAIGDTSSRLFPEPLRRFYAQRTNGDIRVNLLINYGWQWDLDCAVRTGQMGSALVSRIDLVVRWGGRRRLSGFLPFQCAYSDIYVLDRLWPEMRSDDLDEAIAWYSDQDVTRGG